MILSPFFKVAALASIFSALTTALLMYLPEPTAATFLAQIDLHNNKLYLVKKWILLFHPFFSLLAMMAITAHCFRTKAHLVIPGAFFGLLWALTEMAQQAFTIVALNIHWRANYHEVTDQALQNAIYTQLKSFFAFWDSMYFLIILAFGLASILFGLALLTTSRFTKLLGVISILIGVFSLFNFTSDYLKITSLLPLVSIWYEWFYGVLQPVWRLMLAFWLWKIANDYMIKERTRCQKNKQDIPTI